MATLIELTFDDEGLHARSTPALRWYYEHDPDEYARLIRVLEDELHRYTQQVADGRERAEQAVKHHNAAQQAAATERRARDAAMGRLP